ncbi:MAG: 1,4-dihydroxy-2-naphthoate polyprenyltransferase [Deltaproteobacteria bacterium]|nr:1,4-dihydroxy-2-naphthoate polyprenyltransferase [Deltaproteobacteria bacterium]MBW2019909.1 1,4-dihydroxy-2-naphthoate polyprenyltransferase [Deltaproteobacteria bacterium]MBW2074965.1 1,4-dihydroxy-2-naphthoate polyprenyltransferase [Deltaproteobacteria bacterium]RLB82413.1 MAG: 1,4-dihydroxy-2-naphthoate polyprenyltransferase [Deltaproteobacteria bacterium]
MRMLGIWILAARPKTLWAAVSPVMIGTAMAYESGAAAWLPALAALFGSVMIQIGTNFANDYFDYKKGADAHNRLGPMRVTQAGLVRPGTMKLATAIAFSLACVAGIYLVWRAGWPIVVIGVLSVLSGILYTAGPYPLGYHGLGDIFVLIFFGPVAVGGTYYVQSLNIEAVVLLAGLAPGLFSVAILTVNNLRDIDGDQAIGKKTLAVRFGRTFARIEYLLSILVASSIPILLYIQTRQHPFSLLTMVVPFAAFPAIQKVFTSHDGPTFNSVLAATGKLLLLYSFIFSLGWLL